MKKYVKCMRVEHYIKNLLIFIPFIFGVELSACSLILIRGILCGFFAFCFMSSVIYIINDWHDRELDRNHPQKSKRPIASGIIDLKQTVLMLVILLGMIVLLCIVGGFSYETYALLGIYLLLNILYSRYLKNIVVLDMIILSLSYVVRIYYGASLLVDVEVSAWLYLTVQTLALYLCATKRLGEWNQRYESTTRKVLANYTDDYLKSIMQLFLGMSLVFYSLWAINIQKEMIGTVVVVIMAVMRYQWDVWVRGESDPIEIVYKDRTMLLLIIIYGIMVLYNLGIRFIVF